MSEIDVVPFSCDPSLRSLFDANGRAEGSCGWFETLAETTLAPGERTVLAVACEAGTALAALPLVQTADGMRALTAPYTTRFAPALANLEGARLLGTRAREYAGGVLRLDAMDAGDPGTAAYIDGLKTSGLAFARYDHFVNWFEPVTNFEDYWEHRPSRLRTTVRRRLSQALKSGAEFRCFRGEFDGAVAIYQEIYGSSWKSAEPHPEFIATMVRKLAPDVRLGVIALAGEPAAAQIWLVRDGKATIFKLAHRESAAEHSPGTLLTHWMAQTLIRDDSLTEIDFGRGDDVYKRDWLERSRLRTGLIAADRRTRVGLTALLREVVPTRLSAHRKRRS
jgi:hypothetical protein